MKRVIVPLVVAALLWFVMFSPWTAPSLNFWYAMTGSACILLLLSWRESHSLKCQPREIILQAGLGIAIALVLWLVFWTGDKLSQLLFDFARPQVDLIYGMKEGNKAWLISLLLLFIIGPAEEIFWRGFIQKKLSEHWSANKGFIVTTLIYTAIHIPSGNFMLVMAALVCGLAWGGLYRLIPQYFPAIVLSHALWDAAAFVWFPL